MEDQSGGAKKFLYSGPKKGEEEEEELPWNFNKNASPRGTNAGQINTNKAGLDIDGVWSIRQNVNIGMPHNKQQDSLTFNVNKNYYSRYGGNKDKEEFGGFTGNASSATSTNQGTGGKSWNMAAGQSRRPFSYSFGGDQLNNSEKPVSPRNTSNSSFANYPPLGNIDTNFGSQSSREPMGNMGNTMGNMNTQFGTQSSREPKTQQNISGTHSKVGQSLNSFSNTSNTDGSFGQSKPANSQVYSNSVFNGSMFNKNNTPW